MDCEDCGEKKDARLRTCLDRLPNLLIVHLKRFELDYTTFETVKLNDRCSFPMVLDVKPYTMKGTDERYGGRNPRCCFNVNDDSSTSNRNVAGFMFMPSHEKKNAIWTRQGNAYDSDSFM